jgi:hypothetical protein
MPKKKPANVRLFVSRGDLEILMSPQDKDLRRHIWYLHSNGYAYRRPTVDGPKGTRVRKLVWFHKEVARRMRGTEEPPRWVRFRNGCGLDCRRRNLIIID